jgi:hypothetical protein
MAIRREVIYDYTFDEQKKFLGQDVERLDSVIRSAEWRVACHPEKCPKIPGTILRVVFTDPFPGIPPMRIFFSITDEAHCTMHWIEYLEDERNREFEDDIPF